MRAHTRTAIIFLVWFGTSLSAKPVETGTVKFEPIDDQRNTPKQYRLDPRTFEYSMSLKHRLNFSKVTIYRVTFPTALESPHKENNTVHAEYYCPDGDGPFPATIILDITGGDQSLSRSMATYFAQHKLATLFVQMAYYGPRRPKEGRLRLLSTDIEHTKRAIRQTVLDMRFAGAWLAARKEVDSKRLGIVGTSLGSFLAALTSEMEPRLHRAVVLLGGGGFIDGYYDHPKAKEYTKLFESLGGTKEMLKKLIAPIDPITYAENLKERKLLIMAGSKDTVVPPKMARALWEASGKQKIVWFEADHYDAILYIQTAMRTIVEHFQVE